jgi:hypothetical protein
MLRWRAIGAFMILAAFLAVFLAAPARAQDTARPTVGGVSSPPGAMIFYLAHGSAGICGPGCSEWIAAEGAVQWDTFKRLLALLDRVGDRNLPVFLKVTGEGNLNVATTLGKIIRARGLDVSAGTTLVSQCAAVANNVCFALKRSGGSLEATLDASSVDCDVVCVLILAGGINRTLPADARIVIGPAHIRNRLVPNVSDEQREGLQSFYNDQFRLYLIQMGVLAELVDIVDRNSQAHRFTRLAPNDWLRLRIVTALAL